MDGRKKCLNQDLLDYRITGISKEGRWEVGKTDDR
jgi:hypothetical protein